MISQRHRFHLAKRFPFFLTCSVCLLIALLVVSCSSPDVGISSTNTTKTPGNSFSTPSVPISQTPMTVVTSLKPGTTPLAPPPQNCAIKPPPQQMHLDTLGANNNVQLVGGGKFWFYGMFYGSVLHLRPTSSDARWPTTKWVVEVGPNYTQPVALRLRNMQTNTLAWWTDAQTPPRAATQTLILNPLTDTQDVGSVPGVPDVPHGVSSSGWSEWGIFPVFFTAGCYSLEVSWSGGSWQSVMAVGS